MLQLQSENGKPKHEDSEAIKDESMAHEYDRKWHSGTAVVRLGSKNSSFSAEIDLLSIAGLPVKFEYEELATATDNFNTQIGNGGFGTVYKGVLPNESVVAVKKITNLGVEGRKDFCTEIGIIGNIHHINLVKLKGYCLQGKQCFLVLEWKERLEIALGTARGLAYLHHYRVRKVGESIVLYLTMMNNNQVQISNFIFPSVLRACSGFGDLGIGEVVHGTIIKVGFAKDSVIQSSLLSMYGEMGCLSYAKKMFDEMTVRDLVSWSSIISSYVENGKPYEGLEMFRLMVSERIRPDSVTMLSVAEACGDLGFLKLARLIHDYIRLLPFSINILVVGLIHGIFKISKIEACREWDF